VKVRSSKPRITTFRLTRSAAASVRRGHPWVFREGFVRLPELESGDVVTLVDEEDNALGVGLFDASSPIAARVFAREGTLDLRLLLTRFEQAFRRRDVFIGPNTTAYRLCNGEGDHLPGMVIDKYGHVAIMRIDGEHLVSWLDALVPPLAKLLAARGVTSLALRRARDEAGDKRTRTLAGDEPPDRLVVFEHGMAMEVDLAHGQKTGAFLDQRDNRALVRSLGKGRARVLNLYSFAGGFSVAAALGGAKHVTSVDIASGAHASAQRSFRENKLNPGEHAFVTADAFVFLDAAVRRGDRFDLVISDPPSFAPNEKTKLRALGAYRKLHGAIARVLDKNGVFCAASCSSHVSMEEFVGTLDSQALGRDDLSVVSVYGHAPDHPTLPAWSEGRYLKMVVLA
jgi:23S rRNA (cytosine1962-C5)-methyltransferase